LRIRQDPPPRPYDHGALLFSIPGERRLRPGERRPARTIHEAGVAFLMDGPMSFGPSTEWRMPI
jgi:hypothetical protein